MNKTGAVLLVLAAAALAALYLFARPQPPAPSATVSSAAPAPIAPVAQAQEFAFDITAGKITGPPQLVVREGERVALRVRSDKADELHVHGYDISAPLPAGEEVVLKFVAAKAGRFEVELHKAHAELGALEVHPR